jgi:hypothetical protein
LNKNKGNRIDLTAETKALLEIALQNKLIALQNQEIALIYERAAGKYF